MLIAIPSKGRPTSVKSQKVLPSATVYVPENEAASYARAGVRNLVPVPNHVRGIAATRNWILDHTDDKWVVMLDDDVKAQGWIKLEPFKTRQLKLTEEEWHREFVRLFDLTEQMKYRSHTASALPLFATTASAAAAFVWTSSSRNVVHTPFYPCVR